MESKSKWPLIIGIAIPVILIIALVIFAYVPVFSIKPGYNFVYYSLEDRSNCYNFNPYQVVNERIEKTPLPDSDIVVNGVVRPNSNTSGCFRLYTSTTPQLYVFDVKKNDYRKVSFEEVQSWQINSDLISPDNIKISSGGNQGDFGGIFGGGSSRDTVWLEGKRGVKEINLSPSIANYYQIKLVGWVIK